MHEGFATNGVEYLTDTIGNSFTGQTVREYIIMVPAICQAEYLVDLLRRWTACNEVVKPFSCTIVISLTNASSVLRGLMNAPKS